MKILERKGQKFIKLSNGKVYDFNGNIHHTLYAKKLTATVVKSDHQVPVFYRFFNSLGTTNPVHTTEEAILSNSYRKTLRTREEKLQYINQYFANRRKYTKISKKELLLQKILIDVVDRVDIIEDGSGASTDINFHRDCIILELDVVHSFIIKWISTRFYKNVEEAYDRWYSGMFQSDELENIVPGVDYKALFMFFKKFYEDNNYKDFYDWDLIEAVVWILSHEDMLLIHNFMQISPYNVLLPYENRLSDGYMR